MLSSLSFSPVALLNLHDLENSLLIKCFYFIEDASRSRISAVSFIADRRWSPRQLNTLVKNQCKIVLKVWCQTWSVRCGNKSLQLLLKLLQAEDHSSFTANQYVNVHLMSRWLVAVRQCGATSRLALAVRTAGPVASNRTELFDDVFDSTVRSSGITQLVVDNDKAHRETEREREKMTVINDR